MSEQTIRPKPYTSDLNEAQWEILAPMLPLNTGRGARNKHPLREIVNAILYINVNACKWADLPHDFPPFTSVSYHYVKWSRNGTWRRINDALRERVREAAGRDKHPSAGAIDSQTAKAASTGGHRGYDGGKRTNGRKKHTLVDSMGLLIVVVVTAASVTDAAGAMTVLRHVSRFDQPRLRTIWADSAYHRDELYELAAERGWELDIRSRPAGASGFVPIRGRWVVERTYGWLGQHRRHAKDYERSYPSSEAQVYISSVRLMLRRLVKITPPPSSAPASTAWIPRIAA